MSRVKAVKVSQMLKGRMESDGEELMKLAIKVTEMLEYANIEYSVADVETIVRVYSAARDLGGNVKLSDVIIAVLSKDPQSENLIRRSLYKIKHQVRNGKRWSGLTHKKPEHANSVSLFNERRMFADKPKEGNKGFSELERLLKRYLETNNEGYLDLLEDEIHTIMKRRGSSEKDAKGLIERELRLAGLFKRFVENPNNVSLLASIVATSGGELTPYLVNYIVEHSRKRSATKLLRLISVKTRKATTVKYSILLKRTAFRKETLMRTSSVNSRKTLFEFARGRWNRIYYNKREQSSDLLLILDRSESMKKYKNRVLELLMGLDGKMGKLILFSEKPKQVKIDKLQQNQRLLRLVFEKEGFGGYTDVVGALRYALSTARGKVVILITDMEQTVKTRGDVVREILRLASYARRVVIYTTLEGKRLLLEQISRERHAPQVARKMHVVEYLRKSD